jgi:hypothetical protein
MGGPTSSYATAGMAFEFTSAHRLPHLVKYTFVKVKMSLRELNRTHQPLFLDRTQTSISEYNSPTLFMSRTRQPLFLTKVNL